MIQIQDNQIIRDGELIGAIHDGIGYMKSKPAPRLVPQIREAAGNPDLKFEVGDAPTVAEETTIQEEIGVTVEVEKYEDTPAQAPQDAVESVKPGRIYDLTDFPDYASDPRMFAKCFINNYGPDAFTEWQKTNA